MTNQASNAMENSDFSWLLLTEIWCDFQIVNVSFRLTVPKITEQRDKNRQKNRRQIICVDIMNINSVR